MEKRKNENETAADKADNNDLQEQTVESSKCGDKQPVENIYENNEIKKAYGKFKNPQELLKAYCELEKEFTKKCQRIKDLEIASAQPDWRERVDKFFEKTPSAKPFARDIASELLRDPELEKDAAGLEKALTRVLIDKFKTPEQLLDDGQFLENYVLNSPRVKQAVVDKYLEEVRAGSPPVTMASGGVQCATPKLLPRTIEEAGMLFLKNNG